VADFRPLSQPDTGRSQQHVMVGRCDVCVPSFNRGALLREGSSVLPGTAGQTREYAWVRANVMTTKIAAMQVTSSGPITHRKGSSPLAEATITTTESAIRTARLNSTGTAAWRFKNRANCAGASMRSRPIRSPCGGKTNSNAMPSPDRPAIRSSTGI
jgi:hypothetical protein